MKTTKTTTTNTLNTNTTNNKTNSKGVKTMKKTRRFKTRLIAGILSAITVPLLLSPESLKPYSAPPSATRRTK